MRYSAASKFEIIRTIEESALGIRRTCEQLNISRSTFYNWYDRYLSGGYDALEDQKPRPTLVWNKVPDSERKAFRQAAEQEWQEWSGKNEMTQKIYESVTAFLTARGQL